MTRPILVLVVALSTFSQVSADREARLEQGRALMTEIRAALERPAGDAVATCTISSPEISAHRAHGDRSYDYKRNLTLSNSLVTYNLKYWMNTESPEGADAVAIEGSSGLGMDRPSAANWYSNNFLEFSHCGKPILKTCLAQFLVVETGGRMARATIAWDTPEAQVVLTVQLAAEAKHLETRLQVASKGEPAEITVGYRAYPGHYPAPRDRRAATPSREFTAPQSLALAPDENRIVLFDELDAQMACGLDFSRASSVDALLELGTYGVTATLRYAAAPRLDCGEVRIWDITGVSLNSAITQVFEAR